MGLNKWVLSAYAAVSVLSMATAVQFNFYYDESCQQYESSVTPSSESEACIEYDVSWVRGGLIAGCGGNNACNFVWYTESGCTGDSVITDAWGDVGSCVAAPNGWRSFTSDYGLA